MFQELNDWRGRNPLNRYRMKNKVTMNDVATMLGVSSISVSAWESGKTYPTNDNLFKIAELMILDPDETVTKWFRWFKAKPGVEAST